MSASWSASQLERKYKELKRLADEIKSQRSQQIQIDEDIVTWLEKHRKINGQPWSFSNVNGHPVNYLLDVYRDATNPSVKRLLILKGRQMQMTEAAVNILIYSLLKRPITAVYTAPRQDQVSRFSKDRFRKALRESNLTRFIAPTETGRRMFSVGRNAFINGSVCYAISAWGDFDALRGIPADLVVVDEMQSIQSDALPVLEENLAFTKGKMIIIGTPLLAGQPFERLWMGSDMREWNASTKTWKPTKQSDNGFVGYHITQHLAPWISLEELEQKRRTYPEQQYLNEVEGLFYTGGSVPYLPEDITSLFVKEHMLSEVPIPQETFMGVDWGSGGTAFSVVSILKPRDDGKLELIFVERFANDTELAFQMLKIKEYILRYNVQLALLDTGYGAMQLQEMQRMFGTRILGVYYTRRPEKPFEIKSTNFGMTALVDRTYLLDRVEQDLIKSKNLIIRRGHDNFDWLVDAFTSQSVDIQQTITGRVYRTWKSAKSIPDDGLHSIAYAYLSYLYQARGIYSSPDETFTNKKFNDLKWQPSPYDWTQTPYHKEMRERIWV